MSVFVIAEAACTWENTLYMAAESIGAAKECGADAWKTQWCSNIRKMADRRNVADHQNYKLLSYEASRLADLKQMCDKAGIEFMCTVFLPEDVEVIRPLVKRFKIASLECRDFALRDAIYSKPASALVSVGAEDGAVLEEQVYGVRMQCTMAYPCEPKDANIRVIARELGWVGGLSDHTTSLLSGAVAVGAGAKWIEKHFRTPGCPADNPDFAHSLPPVEFKTYVENIRQAEVLMGDGKKRVLECEKWALRHKVVS